MRSKSVYQFCRIGTDGTQAAWWLNDEGQQQVVAVGGFDSSGLLFADTIDFLRALSVGHSELGVGQMELDDVDEEYVNHHLREWLTNELEVTIPATGQELALRPNRYWQGDEDESGSDPFLEWVARVEESVQAE